MQSNPADSSLCMPIGDYFGTAILLDIVGTVVRLDCSMKMRRVYLFCIF